jgi:hypothetical protein
MLRMVLCARAMPVVMASSKLVVDVALISETFATDMTSRYSVERPAARRIFERA